MISVIVVNYKVPELLSNCIRRLKESDYDGHWEIIVVDNASNDGSRERIMSSHPDVIWIQNDKNEGFASAANKGIRRSSGEFVLLLNPDTEIHPRTLAVIDEFFSSHPEAGIVGGKITFKDGSIQPQCRRNIPSRKAAFFRLFGLKKLFPDSKLAKEYELPLVNSDKVHEVGAVSGALMCIRRTVLEQIGYLDAGFFLYGEDLDICYRVTQGGYKIYYVPDAQAIHIRGASRKKRPLKTLWNIHHAMARFYRKHKAPNSNMLFNALTYLVIWSRWFCLFIWELLLIPTNGSSQH